MLADGLTKGTIDRAALSTVGCGTMAQSQKSQSWQSKVHRTASPDTRSSHVVNPEEVNSKDTTPADVFAKAVKVGAKQLERVQRILPAGSQPGSASQRSRPPSPAARAVSLSSPSSSDEEDGSEKDFNEGTTAGKDSVQAGQDFDTVAQIQFGDRDNLVGTQILETLQELGGPSSSSSDEEFHEARSGNQEDDVSMVTVPESVTAPARSRDPSRGRAAAAASAGSRDPSRAPARGRSSDRKNRFNQRWFDTA